MLSSVAGSWTVKELEGQLNIVFWVIPTVGRLFTWQLLHLTTQRIPMVHLTCFAKTMMMTKTDCGLCGFRQRSMHLSLQISLENPFRVQKTRLPLRDSSSGRLWILLDMCYGTSTRESDRKRLTQIIYAWMMKYPSPSEILDYFSWLFLAYLSTTSATALKS